ncbi:hypothetical protein M501DRAFT_1003737 [Patellaria atrata CBS 101060]|uniref:Uncharacterized protein n=1 Tax=Patellaria atrata CBS 101060 TaxID=1346257 RepID=A0A9P4SAR6_9PEZI|nr:hypothetical protein M501DRAFT_1003737 [Patellaria atrata CBS 101060]
MPLPSASTAIGDFNKRCLLYSQTCAQLAPPFKFYEARPPSLNQYQRQSFPKLDCIQSSPYARSGVPPTCNFTLPVFQSTELRHLQQKSLLYIIHTSNCRRKLSSPTSLQVLYPTQRTAFQSICQLSRPTHTQAQT